MRAGFIVAVAVGLCACSTGDIDIDGDGFPANVDCKDDDAGIYPAASEIPYDGIDQDCDGADLVDLDHDGVAGIPAGGNDCDDSDPSRVPGSAEIAYNGIDDDCNIATADDDADLDHWGIYAGDCNDDDDTIHPGADDAPYDGIDQDCSGSDLLDVDGDGYTSSRVGGPDCDDTRTDVHPEAVDACGDGVDQDCDGVDTSCSDLDLDGDGLSSSQGDCDDLDPAVGPGNPEIPYTGVDEDCDPVTLDDDLDGDAFARRGGGDCDDDDASVHPGADEIPYDGVDQDCSGTDLIDVDRDGWDAVEAGGTDCADRDGSIHPEALDVCGDGIDQDCKGGDATVCLFTGVRTNLPIATMGWQTPCYVGSYQENFVSIEEEILAACPKNHLLLACRATGSETLRVAASGKREDVLFDTGVNAFQVHTVGGVSWYFNPGWSWGFAPEGHAVNKADCDVSSEDPGERLCWRTANGRLNNGFRCGNQLDVGTGWERVVFQRD